MTDYTDPTTVDVDVVLGEINHAFRQRGDTWTDRLSWPNVTVKALADEVERLRALLAEAREELDRWGHGDFHYGPTPRDPGVVAMLARIDSATGNRAALPASATDEPTIREGTVMETPLQEIRRMKLVVRHFEKLSRVSREYLAARLLDTTQDDLRRRGLYVR